MWLKKKVCIDEVSNNKDMSNGILVESLTMMYTMHILCY